MKKIGIAVVVLVIATAGRLAMRMSPPEPDSPADLPRAERDPGPGPDEPRDADETVRDEGEPPAGDGSSTPAEAPPTPFRVSFLEGRLVDLDERTGGAARLEGRAVLSADEFGYRRAAGQANHDGRFMLDLGPVLAGDPFGEIDRVRLSVDHPYYMPASTDVPLWSDDEVVVALRFAGAVAGRVTDADGRPARDAHVSIHRGNLGERLTVAVETAATDRAGRYRLRSPFEGPHQVVALVAGCRPASAAATVMRGQESEAPTIAGEAGEAITGRVLAPGRIPLAVRATARAAGIAVGERRVHVEEGRLENTVVLARVGDDGTFRLEGLGRGSYELTVEGVEAVVHPEAVLGEPVVATAPRDDVVFRIEAAVLRVYMPLRDVGPRPTLTVVGESRVSREIRPREHVLFYVGPAREYRLESRVAGIREPVSVAVVSPPAGDVRDVIIQPPAPGEAATLSVELRSPPGSPAVRRAGFAWISPADGEVKSVMDVTARRGFFALGQVPAGTWVLAVRPGGSWWSGGGPWCEERRTEQIAKTGHRDITIGVKPAGRFRILVRGGDGRVLRAWCRVLDAKDREVPLTFVHRTGDVGSRDQGRLGAAGVNDVEPALAVGKYRLVVSANGHAEKTVPFEIEAGSNLFLEVSLDPR